MRFDPAFYSSKRWRAFRRAYLLRHPLCAVAGYGQPAHHVDHAQSRASGGADLDEANFVGYCVSHHSQKTAQCDDGFGNQRSAAEFKPAVKGSDANGWPLDDLWRDGR